MRQNFRLNSDDTFLYPTATVHKMHVKTIFLKEEFGPTHAHNCSRFRTTLNKSKSPNCMFLLSETIEYIVHKECITYF